MFAPTTSETLVAPMDLSETLPSSAPAPHGSVPLLAAQDLVAQLGAEVCQALAGAMERVNTISATGRLDRGGLRLLQEELERARRVGIMGQQVSRLAAGHIQLSQERLNLTQMFTVALRERSREIDARGIELSQTLAAAEVTSDTTLLFSLLQSLFDWAFEHTLGRVDCAISFRSWPARARVQCAFAYEAPDRASRPDSGAKLDTMSWRLVQQTAAVLGLTLQRDDRDGRTQLSLEFPDTLAPRVEDTGLNLNHAEGADTPTHSLLALLPVAATAQAPHWPSHGPHQLSIPSPAREVRGGHAAVALTGALAGRRLVVLAPGRELRNTVREALRGLGLQTEYASAVGHAAALCRENLPDAFLYDSGCMGGELERLRRMLLVEQPAMIFILLTESGRSFETLNGAGRQFGSIGRDAIVAQLPNALMHEMARLAPVHRN
jgi:hypothetical protein